VHNQRQLRKKHDAGKRCDGMNADQINLLKDIGFVWVVNKGWDAMYEQLKDFKKSNGDTNVSQYDPDNKVSMILSVNDCDSDSVIV
jgi:hypothetical protein